MINFYSLLFYIFLSSLLINLSCNLIYRYGDIIKYFMERIYIFFQNPMRIEIELDENFDPEYKLNCVPKELLKFTGEMVIRTIIN